jgi:putative Mn2+ efflux pump MntP
MSGIDFPSILVVAIGLSADCFAVALVAGISQKHFSFLRLLRLPLLFGTFQAFMAVIGWLAGRSIEKYISGYDHWVAFALLVIIGTHMIWYSFHSRDKNKQKINMASWFILIALSIVTSIDALAVGLSFALLRVNITLVSITIGVTAFVVTLIGIFIGKKVGTLVGPGAEIIGGIVLVIIGIRILLEHLL